MKKIKDILMFGFIFGVVFIFANIIGLTLQWIAYILG